jgi:hypothetical protein
MRPQEQNIVTDTQSKQQKTPHSWQDSNPRLTISSQLQWPLRLANIACFMSYISCVGPGTDVLSFKKVFSYKIVDKFDGLCSKQGHFFSRKTLIFPAENRKKE